MARTISHKLATDVKFRAAFLLLGVAISAAVGLITGKLGFASLVLSAFVIASGLIRYQHESSLRRQQHPQGGE